MSGAEFFIPLLVFVIVLQFVGIAVYLERKQSALMQDRLGANYADIFGIRLLGIFHPIADLTKMLIKEDFVPAKANAFFQALSPCIAVFAPLFAFAFVPFAPDIVVFSHPLSSLFVFAFSSLGVYAAVLGGWGSHNKFSLLGALRASAQMLSYEIVLATVLLAMALFFGTFDLSAMVQQQQGFFLGIIPKFGLFQQPLLFGIFLIASIAETKRSPFDLPEGESEIIGFHAEYSGMRFGQFFMAEFIEITLSASLVSLIFLGGWHLGFTLHFSPLLNTFIYLTIFLGKVFLLVFFQMLVRWTLPRFRIDQVMDLCWQVLLPLTLLNLLGIFFFLGMQR